jgi:hypothetical protein
LETKSCRSPPRQSSITRCTCCRSTRSIWSENLRPNELSHTEIVGEVGGLACKDGFASSTSTTGAHMLPLRSS